MLSEAVSVFETRAVAVEQAVLLCERSPDKLIEFVGLAVDVLQDEADGVIVREVRTVTDPLAVTVDVLEDACVFVGVVLELGVFDILVVTLLVNVLTIVPEIRAVELVVFEVVRLPVDVVDEEGVLVDKEHLDAVDDADVVLEVVAVAELVGLLRVLGVPFALPDLLGDPVDVLDGPIERVVVDDPVPDLDGCGDLVRVGEPVLVFDVLTLPVVVFVGGSVLDTLADNVDVRVAAIVCVNAGLIDGVFEGAAVCVLRNVGPVVIVGAAVTVCLRLG